MSQKPSRSIRNERVVPPPRRNTWLPIVVGLLVVLVVTGGFIFSRTRASQDVDAAHDHGEGAAAYSAQTIEIPHLHGLGFGADGRELIVPAHTGLRVFEDGRWRSPDVPAHDYMGFAPTDDGFYSSGHPAPGSDLPNPLGLVKSTDGGKTLTTLGFQGESDFHLMGVGYKNHAVYVVNPAPNSRLSTGLYWSVDDGATWQRSEMQGITASPFAIAVHPTEANVVALATEAGLFLSNDHGDSFKQVGSAEPVAAVTFSPDGTSLLFGATQLMRYDLGAEQIEMLSAPSLGAQDALSYIAVNPTQPQELAVATFERNIYHSRDGGQSWQPIAQNGVGLQPSS